MASRFSKYAKSVGKFKLVQLLDDHVSAIKDGRSKRYRDLVTFLRRCPDSIYSGGHPPGYKGPSGAQIAEMLAKV